MRKAVMVERAVKPAGPYSHAVVANGFVYVSGQGPAHPDTGLVPNGFAAQVRQTLANLRTILEGVDARMDDVVKINCYLSDLANFDEYNAIYREFFGAEPPARTTVGCQLPGIDIEIDCVALARAA